MSHAPEGSDSTRVREPSLLRALGPGMAIAVVVGNVIGSGIYVKPGRIAYDAGDFRVILAAWVIGGLICLMGSLCLAELGAMLPGFVSTDCPNTRQQMELLENMLAWESRTQDPLPLPDSGAAQIYFETQSA